MTNIYQKQLKEEAFVWAHSLRARSVAGAVVGTVCGRSRGAGVWVTVHPHQEASIDGALLSSSFFHPGPQPGDPTAAHSGGIFILSGNTLTDTLKCSLVDNINHHDPSYSFAWFSLHTLSAVSQCSSAGNIAQGYQTCLAGNGSSSQHWMGKLEASLGCVRRQAFSRCALTAGMTAGRVPGCQGPHPLLRLSTSWNFSAAPA